MKAKKIISVFLVFIMIAAVFTGCSSSEKAINSDTEVSKDETPVSTDNNIEDKNTESESGTVTTPSESSDSVKNESDIEASDGESITEQQDSSEMTGSLTITAEDGGEVKEDGNKYILTKTGEYHVRGTCGNRIIYVDAPEQDLDIHLEGVSMTSEIGALIYVENAEEVTVSATDGTNNELIDNRPARANKNEDAEYGNAAIYSKDDLKFKGRGRLTVKGSYNNGIACKNDIKIKNLTLNVTAQNNGIKGNDSVTIESGNITIEAIDGNGIKTENTHISDKGNQKGYVTITGGKVNITSGDESIDAAYDLIIDSNNASVVRNK
ncbi:MAG: carbohydrate-binding domain-containing protein [Lachnospiraceae bacterium]|nr:carbohydrate-binding domain-containing protein [Lachnospiraceae bacterium]